jgi:hypothetical protein
LPATPPADAAVTVASTGGSGHILSNPARMSSMLAFSVSQEP